MVRADNKTCKSCKYCVTIVSCVGKGNKTGSIACDYMIRTGHSRIFENEKMICDKDYCMKYEAKKEAKT